MSDFSIPGISSKYNTDQIIEDLMAAERIPLDRMEQNITDYEDEKRIWQDLNRRVSSLQRTAKKLYGFENPFNEKVVDSSLERVLTATATREADFSEYTLKVVQQASVDKFVSDPVDTEYRVPEGTYTFQVGEEDFSLRYRGGRLRDFIGKVNQKGEGLLRMTLIRNTSDTEILVVEGLKEGAANVVTFSGDSTDFVQEIGLMRPIKIENGSILLDQAQTAEGASWKDDGRIQAVDGGFFVPAVSSLNIPIRPAYTVSNGTVLSYEIKVETLTAEDYKTAPPPDPQLPDVPGIRFQDITINSAENAVNLPEREVPDPPPVRDDFQVVFINDNGISVPMNRIEDNDGFVTVEIPLAGRATSIDSIEIRNNNTYRNIEIRNINLSEPQQRGNLEPSNPVTSAQDAILLFEGITIQRGSNTIDDLIPGVTLNVQGSSEEEIDLSIEPDVELVTETLIEFVYNYNQIMTQILVLTSDDPAVVHELEYLSDEQRDEAMEILGKYRGDITMMQLKSRMQTIVAESYETFLDDEMALLTQIGISTNETGRQGGGSIDFTKLRGYLEIDEETLKAQLENNMLAVKELFGLDTDGDYIIDSGVAKRMDEYLTPYSQTGGFLATRISRIDSQIDRQNDEIDDYKEHLADYEMELKRKYGQMEGALNQLEHSSGALDNFNNSRNNR